MSLAKCQWGLEETENSHTKQSMKNLRPQFTMIDETIKQEAKEDEQSKTFKQIPIYLKLNTKLRWWFSRDYRVIHEHEVATTTLLLQLDGSGW